MTPNNETASESIERILIKYGHYHDIMADDLYDLMLQERIAESDLWLNEWGKGKDNIGDGSWEDYHEHRIEILKAQLEKETK